MIPLGEMWADLSPLAQDALILAAALAPGALIGVLVLRGVDVWPMVRALLARSAASNALFMLLIALSVGVGAALLAQERALRGGAARAADKFDVIIAAPGSQVQMLLAAVYLQPADAPLLGGDVLAAIQDDPQITLIAPLAFGDSWRGRPIVGSTAEFVAHLSGPLAEGRIFAAIDEVVVGARLAAELGDTITPVHGQPLGGAVMGDEHAHVGVSWKVVGRMARTGSPWDRAIVAPVEAIWDVHGLAMAQPSGGSDGAPTKLGPPFDPTRFPGAPAILVRGERLFHNYAIASRYSSDRAMAFFPAAVLTQLYGVLGDVREAMSLMATLSQALVAASVMIGLAALMQLFRRRFALLRALGAPRRYVMGVAWAYAASLICAGAALGLVIGQTAAYGISALISARFDVALHPGLGWPEVHMVAAFMSGALMVGLFPAFFAYRRAPLADLRAA